ncbi:MAG: Secretion system C-terminal sorting domain, partial [Bacteroidota bacterium]
LVKILSINDNINNDIKYKVFPTVVQDNLNIAFESTQNERFELAVIDAAGRIVSQQNIESGTGFQVFNMDASNLTTGLHFVCLTTKNGIAVAKVIKE